MSFNVKECREQRRWWVSRDRTVFPWATHSKSRSTTHAWLAAKQAFAWNKVYVQSCRLGKKSQMVSLEYQAFRGSFSHQSIDTHIFLMPYSTHHLVAAVSSFCNLSGVFSPVNKSFPYDICNDYFETYHMHMPSVFKQGLILEHQNFAMMVSNI